MGFLSGFIEELGARRGRLRAAAGDWRASLFEAVVIGMLAVGAMAPLVHTTSAQPWWWGLLPPAGLALGMLALEARRQMALRRGVSEGRLRRGYDALALALALAMAGIAAFLFWRSGSQIAPPAQIELPETVPEDVIYFDLPPRSGA